MLKELESAVASLPKRIRSHQDKVQTLGPIYTSFENHLVVTLALHLVAIAVLILGCWWLRLLHWVALEAILILAVL